jgi:hypothetical protein
MVQIVLEAILKNEKRRHDEMSKLSIRLTNPKEVGTPATPQDLARLNFSELIEHEERGATGLHALPDDYKQVDGDLLSTCCFMRWRRTTNAMGRC